MTMEQARGGVGAAFFASRFAIDENICQRLLAAALSRGGDYAELYFEHRDSGNITFEDQKVKSAGGGVMQGVGIRVIRGDSIGYAYTEDFSFESMQNAAETAAHISTAGDRTVPVDVSPVMPPCLLPGAQPLHRGHGCGQACRHPARRRCRPAVPSVDCAG